MDLFQLKVVGQLTSRGKRFNKFYLKINRKNARYNKKLCSKNQYPTGKYKVETDKNFQMHG